MRQVIVKCSSCKISEVIKEGQIPQLGYPMCPKCYMPMTAVRAEVTRDATT